jgi:hypothetical protein
MQQLEDEARRRGWRLQFRDVSWGTMGCELRVLRVFKGPTWCLAPRRHTGIRIIRTIRLAKNAPK